MDRFSDLKPSELQTLGDHVVDGARQIESARRRRRNLIAGSIAVALVVGVTGTAFAAPLLAPPPIAAPVPSKSDSPVPADTPTPRPTSSVPAEPMQLATPQEAQDIVPDVVAGQFDPTSTRLLGADDAVKFFVARGAAPQNPYCLILVPTTGPEGWAIGCGTLDSVRTVGAVVGEAQLSTPGTAPAGWTPIDEFVSVNPAASRTPLSKPEPTQPPHSPSYSVAELQSDLDAIGPDVAVLNDQAQYDAHRLRGSQTETLASTAAEQLHGPVALIRPTFVGFPDDVSDSPNSLLWWVVTSEQTEFAYSHTHHVDGMEWTGWGQGDRDLASLQSRLSSWLAQNRPNQNWTIVTQSH
ncbi:hypothetical protein HF576_08745 [Microbacterium sp. CFH 90308]|uniref:Uncharacterized protein n=1 Tax=Microbacterium salsuginis TaxID=2722803 RepID=A0ABX1KD01_9MICO|nr:hypothetical protein [Microbacterium sp. CFH 90308]NLP83934.1 hypothetical protein [Microbacterium sp. CFH 90308]